MIKIYLIFILASFFLAGCAHQKIYTPLSKANIPLLDNSKSRIYFYRGGVLVGGGLIGKVINAKNNDLLVSQLNHNDCTYIDFDPGNYKFRAGNNSWGPNELVTEISIKSGRTYYMMWIWVIDKTAAYFGPERGSHFLNLIPEQGSKVFSSCNYKLN